MEPVYLIALIVSAALVFLLGREMREIPAPKLFAVSMRNIA